MCRFTHEEIEIAAYLLWLDDFVKRPEVIQGQDFYYRGRLS